MITINISSLGVFKLYVNFFSVQKIKACCNNISMDYRSAPNQ